MAHYPLRGRTLFITGGASGIGAETARQAAQRGARLALVDINGEAAKALAATLPAAIGIGADVRDYDALEKAAQTTADHFGGIDVVIANAGIGIVGTAQSMTLDDIERIVDINFTGVFRTVKATLPHVIDRRGYVLVTASFAALFHVPPLIHYTATKAGIEAFGDVLRIESADRGVDVGVAYYGFIETPMVSEGYQHPAITAWRAAHPPRGLAGKTYPVSGAARATIRGIESRARRVIYPRAGRILMTLRSAMPRVAEAMMRHEDAAGLVRGLEAHSADSQPILSRSGPSVDTR